MPLVITDWSKEPVNASSLLNPNARPEDVLLQPTPSARNMSYDPKNIPGSPTPPMTSDQYVGSIVQLTNEPSKSLPDRTADRVSINPHPESPIPTSMSKTYLPQNRVEDLIRVRCANCGFITRVPKKKVVEGTDACFKCKSTAFDQVDETYHADGLSNLESYDAWHKTFRANMREQIIAELKESGWTNGQA